MKGLKTDCLSRSYGQVQAQTALTGRTAYCCARRSAPAPIQHGRITGRTIDGARWYSTWRCPRKKKVGVSEHWFESNSAALLITSFFFSRLITLISHTVIPAAWRQMPSRLPFFIYVFSHCNPSCCPRSRKPMRPITQSTIANIRFIHHYWS